MPQLDISTVHSFSPKTPKPVLSPCHRHIAYVIDTSLVVKETQTLRTVHIFPLGPDEDTEVTVSAIKWEPLYEGSATKIAVLVDNLNVVKIFDFKDVNQDSQENVPITINDSWEGIENFDWIPPCVGDDYKETAYRGSKQLMVFSKANLKCTLYSLDLAKPVTTLYKPKFSHIVARPNSNIWSVVLRERAKDYLLHFQNHDSYSTELFTREILNVLDARNILWSESGKWLLVNHLNLAGIKVSLFNSLGVFDESNTPVFQLTDSCDSLSLGADAFKWISHLEKDILLVGTLEEKIIVFQMDNLKVVKTITHQNAILGAQGTLWREYYDSKGEEYYFKKLQAPFEIPSLFEPNSALRGIKHIETNVAHTRLAIITHSMPETIFVYGSNYKLLSIITSLSEVVSMEWHPSEPELQFATVSHVSLFCDSSFEVRAIPTLKNAKRIQHSQFIIRHSGPPQSTGLRLNLVILDHSSFVTTAFHQDTGLPLVETETSPLRKGSPEPFTNDDATARDLAAGVQQNEWANNLRDTAVDDTFKLKRPRIV
ncbi:hypothetical protein BABINDRAFT_161583 [Babjeviella inositovora NRRL Y-12698]|uniref:Uncharacterized protein n=1 Tax=Babjeviella inositovora NRRL Y-12698 TaxID=984486 RepID=A0A1E3QQD7_9ASCO|nr:uncharacterized protein BABINDRAFT_161583 [Babjeviella inositovora NRRL Y-12698]ODQ79916.1 hypothetical protein BABINDRAFT_161583 [Babjeviella inositovora NRRL Y-12698]